MICVGIDVAKDKHDCFILSSEGEVLADVFTIPNNRDGFETLLQRIRSCALPADKIKVGLEATGHYSYNILGFLLDCGLATYVINPLHTNLYRKSLSLRKTKTDRIDARTIAAMLMSDVNLKSYTDTAYHNEELKSLTRYRFDKVRQRAKLKQSVSRLVNILFPELETIVPTLHMASVYALLSEFPGAQQIADTHLTHLKTLLDDASKGRYIDALIARIDICINTMVDKYEGYIVLLRTIPGVDRSSAITILSEVGVDMTQFGSSKRLCCWAGLTPGNNESAGKKKSVRISRAGVYLKPALVQVAHAAVKDKLSPYYALKYERISKRRGKKRAIIAIARMILTAVFVMLSNLEEWNPVDLYRVDMPEHLKEKQLSKAVKQAIHFLKAQGLTVLDSA